jgi:PAS domain S-box-containing protein
MPFRPDPFLERFEPLRRARARPAVAIAAILIGPAISVLARMAAGDLLAGVPFITFYPAVAIAALVGGARAGVISLVLSATLANYFFLPPQDSWKVSVPDFFATGLFVLVAGLIVGLIALLNEAIDRLWRQGENNGFILDVAPAGMIAVDEDGRINLVNAAVEKQLGYERDDLLGQPVEMLVPTSIRNAHETLRGHFMTHPESRPMGAGRDLNALRKDGTLIPVEVALNPYEREGRSGALATIVDISERKRMQSREQVLTHEVSHRANNLLMVVQMLAKRMLSGDQRTRFLAVLQALSRTHNILAKGAPASLRSIVLAELAGLEGQFELLGCDVRLTREAAQDITLIVHELATNALKYGAFSTAEGKVLVEGEAVDGLYRFGWEERSGPPVVTPTRRGFGSEILGKVAGGIAIEVSAEYAPEGFRYRLTCAVERIALDAAALQPVEAA